MWEFYDDEPEQAAIFNSWMTIQKSGKKDWLDAYPLEERVIADFREDADAALLVDVGGGRGHVLKGIKARCDTKSGRLVLQDVPKTVAEEAGTLTKQGIESMAYDFFTPQPIKGTVERAHGERLKDSADLSARGKSLSPPVHSSRLAR